MALAPTHAIKGELLGGTETFAFPYAVADGDLLYLVFAGHGFGTPPQAGIASAVGDSVNGSWSKLPGSDTGNRDDGASHNWAGSFWLFAASAAATGGLFISITSSAGQSPADFVAVQLPGAGRHGPIGISNVSNSITSDPSGNLLGPALGGRIYQGALVVSWITGYSGGVLPAGGLGVGSGWVMDGSNAGSDACIAVAHRAALTVTDDTQARATFTGFFTSSPGAAAGTALIFDNRVVDLYLNPANRAIVTQAPDGIPIPPEELAKMPANMLVFPIPVSVYQSTYSPAWQDARAHNLDLAVAVDGSFDVVPHILTQDETDRGTLTSYLAIGSPTLAQTASALKALTRLTHLDITPFGIPIWPLLAAGASASSGAVAATIPSSPAGLVMTGASPSVGDVLLTLTPALLAAAGSSVTTGDVAVDLV